MILVAARAILVTLARIDRAFAAPRTAAETTLRLDGPREPSLCFEILVPFHDAARAKREGVPIDTRYTLAYEVWAPQVRQAVSFARERFADHRFRNRTARIAAEGPVALRVVSGTPIAASA